MRLIDKIIHPLLSYLNHLFHYTPKERIRDQGEEEGMTEEQLETTAEVVGANQADLEEEEMIHGIEELPDTEVKEIMLPRPDMICAEENSTLDQIRELVKKGGHSRIPIYKENIDNITGIIHVKDLFLKEAQAKKIANLSQLARKAYFVPETKKIDELLREFRRDKNHMAIVVDEYGGTAGLVTLEDILEEIVGEIQDEYDMEVPPIQKLDDRTYRVDAKVSIEDLNEKLGTKIAQKGFETVGGFIYDLVGSVPEEGKVLEFKSAEIGLKIVVEKVVGQRIKTAKVTLTPIPASDSPSKNNH
ncbi:MAG: hemolysin family protein [Candidatus Zixiibacteriota bacterium]